MSTKKIHTFCRICEPGCGLLAEVDGDQLLSLKPDKEHPVHKGFACHKGIYFKDVNQDPDRLDGPVKRVGARGSEKAEFQSISWDAAMSEIAAKQIDIRDKYGEEALAGYFGNPVGFSSATFQNLTSLMRGAACRTLFSAGTQDCTAKFAGSEAMFGSIMVHPISDLANTDYLLCVGANPKISHMSFVHVSDPMAKIKGIAARGGKVVFVNPRRIESSIDSTGEVLLINPDTDFYFLAGVLHEIIFNIGIDQEAVKEKSVNLEKLIEFVQQYPIERIAKVTGIDVADIRQVAHEFAAAPSASVHMSTGANQGRQGLFAYWMLNMISLVTGNLGRHGGNVYSPGFFPMAQFSKTKGGDPFFDSPFGDMRRVGVNLPATLLPDMIENGSIKSLVVFAGNPILTVPGGNRLRKALEQLELLVVIDLYRNATGELADYALAATDWLEHDDVNSLSAAEGVALEPYVQYTPAVVPPKAERRDDWWILSRLAQELGLPSLLDQPDPDPHAGLRKMLKASDLSIEKLQELPCQTALLPEIDPNSLFELGIQHEHGKVDCCPELFKRGYGQAESILKELEQEDPDQLKLISRRTNYMINSWMNNLSSLKVASNICNPLWINPDDALQRGLADGERVRIYNEHGELDAELSFDDTLKSGVVAMSHGWGNQNSNGLQTAQKYPGVNVNELAPTGPGSYDILSNQAHMTGINVEIKKLA